MDEPNPSSQSLLPVVVEEHTVDLVRVEKSLQSLGFFASTASTKEISRTIVQVIRRPDGQRIQAKAVIEGIPSLGLPTTADRDKYMAFMKIALDQRARGELQNPVRFSGADMIKLLRLRKGGFHYDEINDWCKRMVATTIMSESSIFLADRRQYASDTFHVFERVVLVGEELHDGTRSDSYQVYLSHWQMMNLSQGYILPLDFNAYLQLRRDIAKALFGHLSVWFYASRGQSVEKNYTELCQLLHIRAYPHLSKARSVLEPALVELTEIGYLSSWELTQTSRGTDFKLSLSPGERLLSLPNFTSVVNGESRASLEASLPSWIAELVTRGVTERRARQMALDLPESQAVMDQIEYADHLIAQDKRGRGKISNPAGFYIWALEQNLSVPAEFETSRVRAFRAARERNEMQEQTRALLLQQEYESFRDDLVSRRMNADYDAEKLESAIKENLKALKRSQSEWFGKVPESTRRELAIGQIRQSVRERINIPTFEQWLNKEGQLRMFA
jgi:hypothetical protein